MTESHVSSSLGARDGNGLTEPKSPEMSLGELFSQLSSDLSTLFRKEVQLAKIEAKEEVNKVTKASASFGVAAVGGLLALIMLSFALAWWIDQALNTAVSFLIVGVLWAIVAAVMLSAGRKKLKDVQVLPQTKETIKEDVEWAKTQKT